MAEAAEESVEGGNPDAVRKAEDLAAEALRKSQEAKAAMERLAQAKAKMEKKKSKKKLAAEAESASATGGGTMRCTDCHRSDLTKKDFAKGQLKKKAEERRCRACGEKLAASVGGGAGAAAEVGEKPTEAETEAETDAAEPVAGEPKGSPEESVPAEAPPSEEQPAETAAAEVPSGKDRDDEEVFRTAVSSDAPSASALAPSLSDTKSDAEGDGDGKGENGGDDVFSTAKSEDMEKAAAAAIASPAEEAAAEVAEIKSAPTDELRGQQEAVEVPKSLTAEEEAAIDAFAGVEEEGGFEADYVPSKLDKSDRMSGIYGDPIVPEKEGETRVAEAEETVRRLTMSAVKEGEEEGGETKEGEHKESGFEDDYDVMAAEVSGDAHERMSGIYGEPLLTPDDVGKMDTVEEGREPSNEQQGETTALGSPRRGTESVFTAEDMAAIERFAGAPEASEHEPEEEEGGFEDDYVPVTSGPKKDISDRMSGIYGDPLIPDKDGETRVAEAEDTVRRLTMTVIKEDDVAATDNEEDEHEEAGFDDDYDPRTAEVKGDAHDRMSGVYGEPLLSAEEVEKMDTLAEEPGETEAGETGSEGEGGAAAAADATAAAAAIPVATEEDEPHEEGFDDDMDIDAPVTQRDDTVRASGVYGAPLMNAAQAAGLDEAAADAAIPEGDEEEEDDDDVAEVVPESFSAKEEAALTAAASGAILATSASASAQDVDEDEEEEEGFDDNMDVETPLAEKDDAIRASGVYGAPLMNAAQAAGLEEAAADTIQEGDEEEENNEEEEGSIPSSLAEEPALVANAEKEAKKEAGPGEDVMEATDDSAPGEKSVVQEEELLESKSDEPELAEVAAAATAAAVATAASAEEAVAAPDLTTAETGVEGGEENKTGLSKDETEAKPADSAPDEVQAEKEEELPPPQSPKEEPESADEAASTTSVAEAAAEAPAPATTQMDAKAEVEAKAEKEAGPRDDTTETKADGATDEALAEVEEVAPPSTPKEEAKPTTEAETSPTVAEEISVKDSKSEIERTSALSVQTAAETTSAVAQASATLSNLASSLRNDTEKVEKALEEDEILMAEREMKAATEDPTKPLDPEPTNEKEKEKDQTSPTSPPKNEGSKGKDSMEAKAAGGSSPEKEKIAPASASTTRQTEETNQDESSLPSPSPVKGNEGEKAEPASAEPQAAKPAAADDTRKSRSLADADEDAKKEAQKDKDKAAQTSGICGADASAQDAASANCGCTVS